MINLSLTFLALTLSFLFVVAASPIVPASNSAALHSHCLFQPYLELHNPFFLCVERTGINCVSRKDSERFLVGDSVASPTSLRLALCVVSTDMDCEDYKNVTDCIHENIEYRIRVTLPTKGYLHVVNSFLEVVPSFQNASGFFLSANGTGPYMASGGSYLHIANKRPIVGKASTLLTNRGSGVPLIFDNVSRSDGSQDFFTLYLTP